MATRAVQLVVAWAFGTLNLLVVELHTMLGNAASEQVAAKAGFEMIGVLENWPHPLVPDKHYDVKHWVRARS